MSSIYNCIMLAALLCFVLVYYLFSVSQIITIHFLLIQRFFYFIGPKMNFLHPCPLTSFLCSVSPSLLPPLFINIGISIFLKRNSFIIARKRGGGGFLYTFTKLDILLFCPGFYCSFKRYFRSDQQPCRGLNIKFSFS